MMQPLDVSELKQTMAAELERRRCSDTGFSYAQTRGGVEALYGLTGAVNILSSLGITLGSRVRRQDAARRILRYRDANGCFAGGAGPGHALHMVVGALNLLAEPLPDDAGPLAPIDPAELAAWLDRHDWQSTHKELCGQTIPLLASGIVDSEWIDLFRRGVASRLHVDRPLETWCSAGAPPWRVISCIYHVLSAFDAGRLPYPHPDLLLQRLLDLGWDDVAGDEQRTTCTDGDWALLLLQLGRQLPEHYQRIMPAIHRVSERRVKQWEDDREVILGATTHDLYCYLWVTAVFQSSVRDHYAGGYLRDTLNDPALYVL